MLKECMGGGTFHGGDIPDLPLASAEALFAADMSLTSKRLASLAVVYQSTLATLPVPTPRSTTTCRIQRQAPATPAAWFQLPQRSHSKSRLITCSFLDPTISPSRLCQFTPLGPSIPSPFYTLRERRRSLTRSTVAYACGEECRDRHALEPSVPLHVTQAQQGATSPPTWLRRWQRAQRSSPRA